MFLMAVTYCFMLALPYNVILRVSPAAEWVGSVIGEELVLCQVPAEHVFVPQYADTRGVREDEHTASKSIHCSRPYVRYRVPDCRSWYAPYISTYLVSNDTISVDLFFTLKEESRWRVDVTNGEAEYREEVSNDVVVY